MQISMLKVKRTFTQAVGTNVENKWKNLRCRTGEIKAASESAAM